jgi:hypothetical protein
MSNAPIFQDVTMNVEYWDQEGMARLRDLIQKNGWKATMSHMRRTIPVSPNDGPDFQITAGGHTEVTLNGIPLDMDLESLIAGPMDGDKLMRAWLTFGQWLTDNRAAIEKAGGYELPAHLNDGAKKWVEVKNGQELWGQ